MMSSNRTGATSSAASAWRRAEVAGTTARVWDTSTGTGKPLTRALTHEDAVENAALSPDGTRVVTASYDKTARVWDAATGKPLPSVMAHQGQAWVMMASSSSNTLLIRPRYRRSSCDDRRKTHVVAFVVMESILLKAISVAANRMRALYELAGGIHHDGEKGAFREYFVAELIRPLLVHHFGLGTGIVIDRRGCESCQTDVLIFDRRLMPPLLAAGDRGVFPIDAVLATIEVKSTLKSEHLRSAFSAARRLAPPRAECPEPDRLWIEAPGTMEAAAGSTRTRAKYPLCALLAYQSAANSSDADEGARLEKLTPGGAEYVRLLGILDKGVWWWDQERGELMASRSSDIGENAALFLRLLLDPLDEIARTRASFQFGHWMGALHSDR
jgi:hypothetical protein